MEIEVSIDKFGIDYKDVPHSKNKKNIILLRSIDWE